MAWISDLISNPAVRVFDWQRSETYARKWSYLHSLTITPGLLDLERDVPAKPVRVIAPAATLVFHDESHRGLVPPLIEAVRRLQRDEALLSPAGTFPSKYHVAAPVDDNAEIYLDRGPSFLYRIFPITVAQVIDRLKLFLIPLLTLLIPLFKLAPPIYRWRMRARVYRWYEVLREVETDLNDEKKESDYAAHVRRLDALESEIASVEIPLSYADELYNLHLHIDYVRRKAGEGLVS